MTMTEHRTSPLDPVLLAKLASLQLRVRAVVEGVIDGLHRSPMHGQSIEFAEHKEYAPGDEIRHVDWKAYARRDRYYVKQYEQETNVRAWLLVDASASMGWRGAPERLTKLEYAATMAGSLGHMLARQQDSVGLVATADRVVRAIPPRGGASHAATVVDALAGLAAQGTTRLESAVDHVVEHAPRGGLVLAFTDLLDPDAEVVRKLALLRRRKHEVVLFHVLDPAEIEFPYEDDALFEPVEGGAAVEARGRDVRRGYVEVFGRWLEELRRSAVANDVEYTLARTDVPLERILIPFLARREQRA
jgi:uncharacterized protein (DUF58 family)